MKTAQEEREQLAAAVQAEAMRPALTREKESEFNQRARLDDLEARCNRLERQIQNLLAHYRDIDRSNRGQPPVKLGEAA